MATAAVRISALRKEYPGRGGHQPVVAVDGIDVEIAAGEIVAFLGPNGAGKTTTLDIALGLVPPTSGTIEVLGTTPRRAVVAGKVSAVLQTGGLLRDLSVGETVRAVAALHHADARVDDVVRRAGLDRLVARKVGKCSGGEQQRLRFALALLPDPQLLILDEPTAGMDAGARREFWETMHAETSGGRTVVFAWLLSGMFALFGLAVAQTFRSESSVNIASAGLVLLAFLGNLFVPLSGAILDIARFTPMYGYSGLAYWPQLQGQIIGADDVTGRDPMWALILNVVVWSAIFGPTAIWAVRRGRRRQ